MIDESARDLQQESSYKVASIDVHKAMLAVVTADAAGMGEYCFERRKFGGGALASEALSEWLTAPGLRTWPEN